MSKKLTLKDRYYIGMYALRLPCTINLRGNIDKFLMQIEITADEVKTHGVKIDSTKNFKFECNDPEYTMEYEKFPPEVVSAMADFVTRFDREENKGKEMIQNIFKYYKKII